MANETELFFLVLIIVLTMIMHFILAWKGPGPIARLSRRITYQREGQRLDLRCGAVRDLPATKAWQSLSSVSGQ